MTINAHPTIHVMHADPIMNAGVTAILSDYADLAPSLQPWQPRQPHALTAAQLIITDYHGGLQICREPCSAGQHRPRVLVVTHFDKEWEVRTALDAGVHGYLLQQCGPQELLKAARLLGNGQRFFSEAVSRCVADSLNRESLTGRETDVLRLLAQGCCNKSIARELGIGVGTVKTHVKGLMGKLQAKARTHAVVVAAQRGLIGAGQRSMAMQ